MKLLIKLISLILILLLSSCANTEPPDPRDNTYRNYEQDQKIQTPLDNTYIIIKEWSLLLSGGADIYFQDKDGNQTYLGETSGADDGYKPFKNNKYTIEFNNENIIISYDFGSGGVWKTNTFTLPTSN